MRNLIVVLNKGLKFAANWYSQLGFSSKIEMPQLNLKPFQLELIITIYICAESISLEGHKIIIIKVLSIHNAFVRKSITNLKRFN